MATISGPEHPNVVIKEHLFVGGSKSQFGVVADNERWPLTVNEAGEGGGWLRFTHLNNDQIQGCWQIDHHSGGLSIAEASRPPSAAEAESRLFLGTGGNVGLGTTTPQHRLDVNGAINATEILKQGSPLVTSQWEDTPDGISYSGGKVGIGTTTPGMVLDVANRMRVRQGDAGSAGIWLYQSGPAADQAFVGMANDSQVGLWGTGAGWGLVMDFTSGNLGIGTVSPGARLSVATGNATNGDNTANFWAPNIGPCISHIHWGTTGDWYIRSAHDNGRVVIQDNNGTIQLGGNKNGLIVKLNDDLWFSDPQNGTIEIRKGDGNPWGTMVGFFNHQCSIAYKKNVAPLDEQAIEGLLHDTLSTKLFHFQYLEDAVDRQPYLGVVAEECPHYLIGEGGTTLSPPAYAAMLHGAIQVLARRLTLIEQSMQGSSGLGASFGAKADTREPADQK